MFLANLKPSDIEIAPDWMAVIGLVVIAAWLLWGQVKKD